MRSRRDHPTNGSQLHAAEPERLPAADADGAPQSSASSSALLKRARDTLVEAGEPLAAAQLATSVFGVASGLLAIPTGPWATMLEKLLAPSPLFARDASGQWRLTAWDIARRSLPDVEFITGSSEQGMA